MLNPRALVIHPTGFTINGGGEVVCLHTIKALKDLGFKVILASKVWPLKEVEQSFRLGHILEDVEWLQLGETALEFRPRFPRLLAYQRFLFALRTLSKTYGAVDNKGIDLTISTQSAIYFNPSSANITIVYDIADFFFSRNSQLWVRRKDQDSLRAQLLQLIYYRPLKFYYEYHERLLSHGSTLFVPLSDSLRQKLDQLGYPHAETLFPPVDLTFQPEAKEKVVVQVSRIVPSKRLEDFVQIASRLPEYRFLIVAKYSQSERRTFGDYPERLFDNQPKNLDVEYVGIRDRPDLLTSAKIYLYTSSEPGINIGACEAMGAGCFPITPSSGGGAEIVQRTGIGSTYYSIEDAITKVKEAMEREIDSQEISRAAQVFSSEHFEKEMTRIIAGRRSLLVP